MCYTHRGSPTDGHFHHFWPPKLVLKPLRQEVSKKVATKWHIWLVDVRKWSPECLTWAPRGSPNGPKSCTLAPQEPPRANLWSQGCLEQRNRTHIDPKNDENGPQNLEKPVPKRMKMKSNILQRSVTNRCKRERYMLSALCQQLQRHDSNRQKQGAAVNRRRRSQYKTKAQGRLVNNMQSLAGPMQGPGFGLASAWLGPGFDLGPALAWAWL